MTSRGSRILTLDLMRGYLLLVILIDHLAKFPGFFELFTGKGWLWVSAAEGFFLISGIMVGLLRGRQAKTKGLGFVTKSILRRSVELYLWGAALTVLFTVVGWTVISNPGLKDGIATFSFGEVVWKTLSFQYIYGWADFLVYYAVFMAFSPLAIWLLTKNKAWVVMLASIGVWLFREQTVFAALQILFVIGLIVGYYLPELKNKWSKLALTTKRTIKRSVYSIASISAFLSVGVVHGREWLGHLGLDNSMIYSFFSLVDQFTAGLFDKWTMDPGRVALSLIWFVAFYFIFRSNEQKIIKYFGWLLLPIGQNSLQVYIAHSFIVFAVWLIWPFSQGLVMNIVLNILCIGILADIIYVYVHGRQLGYPPGRFLKDSIFNPGLRTNR